jgi:predicted transcriptional regulator
MSLPKKIVEVITANPGMNCGEITKAVEGKPAAVKVALWKMAKEGKIVREKKPAKERQKGPQSEYVYSCVSQ